MLLWSLAVTVGLSASLVSTTTITDDYTVAANRTFDYVISGAGLTGIVVGNKLSARGFSVLIIEAGPDARNEPAINDAERRNDLPEGVCNWKYQASADDGTPLKMLVDSGRCVGGSTSINGMAWYHPTKPELDAIAQFGNPGWDWDHLLPYMIAAEHNIPPNAEQRAQGADLVPADHGFQGPVNVSFPTPMRIPDAVRTYKAAVPVVFPGIKPGKDLSDRKNIVMASLSWTLWYDPVAKINKRSSAAHSYLYAANQQREKLTVLTGNKVTKVLFNPSLRAKGVEFGNSTSGGTIYQVFAKKEVLLALGTLGTPPVLELSGIGGSAILKKYGIKQLVDLPGVGLNLHDQPGTAVSALINTANASNTGLVDNRNIFAPVIALVNLDNVFEGNASKIAQDLKATTAARAQAAVAAGTQATLEGAKALFGTLTSLIVDAKMPIAEFIGESYPAVFSAIVWPLLPFSRGTVHIGSSDPFARPVITPRFLSDEFDLDVAVAVSKKSRQVFQTPAFSPLVANAYITVAQNATDNDWAQWYRNTSYGASHWVGTSAMLPRKLGGVVDPRLRVYGTSNLRVVDISILPLEVTCHTMPVAYAIAQKAADLILADA